MPDRDPKRSTLPVPMAQVEALTDRLLMDCDGEPLPVVTAAAATLLFRVLLGAANDDRLTDARNVAATLGQQLTNLSKGETAEQMKDIYIDECRRQAQVVDQGDRVKPS